MRIAVGDESAYLVDRVTVNGNDVTARCFEADDKEGWARCYEHDPGGRTFLCYGLSPCLGCAERGGFDDLAVEVLEGRVEISWNWRWQRLK